MKYILTFIVCLGFLSLSSTFGQEETKKVVVVKKMIDENGKTTTERHEASGQEADELIKKLKEDGSIEGVDIEIEVEKAKKSSKTKKEISIEKSMKNGEEMTTYKIVTEENGEKKVMVWDGEGEMPKEMAEKMKNVDVESKTMGEAKEMMIIVDTEDDDEEKEIHEEHMMEKKIVVKKENKNKVSLGIMIEDDSQGVEVSEIVPNSVAEKSGLKSGDTILKINDSYVFNTEMLLQYLSKFDKGDKIKVTYLREGKEKSTNAKF